MRPNLHVNSAPGGVLRVGDIGRTTNGGPLRKRVLRPANLQASECLRKSHRRLMSIRARRAVKAQGRSQRYRRLCLSHPETPKAARQREMEVLVGLIKMLMKDLPDPRLDGRRLSKCPQICSTLDLRLLRLLYHPLSHLLTACRHHWSALLFRLPYLAGQCPT